MRKFYLMNNVGSCKYVVNFHDGIKVHSDGSPFYDIEVFANKKLRDQFCKDLKRQGYIEER